MRRRALTGLALFACLMASGWAWQQMSEEDPDHEGSFVRITVMEGRDALCAATSGPVPEGIMRISGDAVSFAEQTCAIAQVRQVSEDTAEGPYGAVELDLICRTDPVRPNGIDATLWVSGRAELTSYAAPSDEGYVEAHATFLPCP